MICDFLPTEKNWEKMIADQRETWKQQKGPKIVGGRGKWINGG